MRPCAVACQDGKMQTWLVLEFCDLGAMSSILGMFHDQGRPLMVGPSSVMSASQQTVLDCPSRHCLVADGSR